MSPMRTADGVANTTRVRHSPIAGSTAACEDHQESIVMGTLTFLAWLRRQVVAESREGVSPAEVDGFINAMNQIALLEYFAMYQQETAE